MANKQHSLIAGVATTVGVLFVVIPSAALAQHGGHGVHPPMPDQKPVLYCRINDSLIETPIVLTTPGQPNDLNQVVELPSPFAPLRLLRFLPKAEIKREVVPDSGPDSRRAVLLSIEGPTQSHQRWLVADDIEHNRLTSYIGSWRYMAVPDQAARAALLEQFQTELTRSPKLLVRTSDNEPWLEMDVDKRENQSLGDTGYVLRVLDFMPHFGIDKDTKKPINQSTERINPAANIQITRNAEKDTRWVFSEFPDFKMSDAPRFDLQIKLDCPVDTKRTTPDFLLVTTGLTKHEVWSRHQGRQSIKPVEPEERIEVEGSQYSFTISRFVPNGRLTEQVLPSTTKAAVSALAVNMDPASRPSETLWLEAGRERVVKTEHGDLRIMFALSNVGSRGFHP